MSAILLICGDSKVAKKILVAQNWWHIDGRVVNIPC
jgi:hypothetical protein